MPDLKAFYAELYIIHFETGYLMFFNHKTYQMTFKLQAQVFFTIFNFKYMHDCRLTTKLVCNLPFWALTYTLLPILIIRTDFIINCIFLLDSLLSLGIWIAKECTISVKYFFFKKEYLSKLGHFTICHF